MANKNRVRLFTDKQTDHLFDYFMNEEKFNEQLRGEWNEQIEKKIQNHQQHQLDNNVITEQCKQPSNNVNKGIYRSEREKFTDKSERENNAKIDTSTSAKRTELPSASVSDSSEDFIETSASEKTGHIQKNHSIRSAQTRKPDPPMRRQQSYIPPLHGVADPPLLGENLIDNVNKYATVPDEKLGTNGDIKEPKFTNRSGSDDQRTRAREAYSKLQDIVDKQQVKLSREFTVDDDPEEMEAEYAMHKERRNKANQVKFYKQILLNIVCGIEFLNDKYDPFEFKLKDWSKQIAADMDDYTEVIEELYEKYKDKGGKMAPEIRLLFMIIMSGVTYHLSQALFGAGGLGNTIKNNPNILNKLLGGLMKPNTNTNTNNGTNTERPSAPTDKNILDAVRRHNQNKQNIQPAPSQVASTQNDNTNKLMEQRAFFEDQLRKQQEVHSNIVDRLHNQLQTQSNIDKKDSVPLLIISEKNTEPVNIFSSSRTSEDTRSNNKKSVSFPGVKQASSPVNRRSEQSKKVKQGSINMDEIIETLDASTDAIESSIKTLSKKSKNKGHNTETVTSSRRPKSKIHSTDTRTDVMTPTKKTNIVRL